ncbi:MAG: galactose oxidase-like domain-containing protein [Planctomycetota bacterium]
MSRISTLFLAALCLCSFPTTAQAQQQIQKEEAFASVGRWLDSFDFPLAIFWSSPHNFKAVHMALIPMDVPMPGGGNLQGKILAWGDRRAFGTEWRSSWMVLDPDTNAMLAGGVLLTDYENSLNGANEGSIFCSGHAWTPEGKLLVAGGMYLPGMKNGAKLVYLFDPSVIPFGGDPWQRQPDLAVGRWYPTVTQLGDSDSMIILGGKNRRSEVEDNYTLYNWRTGTFNSNVSQGPPGAWHNIHGLFFYPRTHLLPNGDIFFSGFMQNSASINPLTRQNHQLETDWDDNYEIEEVGLRVYGESLMLPLRNSSTLDDVRIQVMCGEIYDQGGLGVSLGATSMVEELSFNPSDAHYRQWSDAAVADMREERWFPNMVQLPDESVLVIGGEADEVVRPLKQPELRVNGVWQYVARPDSARGYHSTALLLPDGRVISGGGDHRRSDFQIFEPPYLFKPGRPVINDLHDDVLRYGQPNGIRFSGKAGKIVLMKPGSRTHHFDNDQRMLILWEGEDDSGEVHFDGPTNGNLAPIGLYMLFLVSPGGVPSEAHWVEVR